MAYELIAVGGSWGGLHALETVLAGLPPEFEPGLVVALHRAVQSERGVLVSVLSSRSPLPVCEAGDKDPIVGGQVHVAPPDYHLFVEPGEIALSVDPPVRYSRPSIDVMLESAADAYGERVIGVLLSGTGADGAAGLLEVRKRGGVTVVQDPADAERGDMPAAAIAVGAAQHVVALDTICPLLRELCAGRRAA